MKRIAAMAITPFVLALLINIILGLVRNSFRWGMIIFRATLSAVVVVGLVFIIIMVVKRFLPELLAPVAEEDEDNEHFEEQVSDSSEDNNVKNQTLGTKIDVMLNDGLAAGGSYYGDFAGQDNVSSLREAGSLTERLKGEDPEVLAKAIRTTLSRDDS